MALHKISSFAKSFREDTRGTVAVEAVIMLPALFWAFMAMSVFFDMYRAQSTSEKAAFTISDTLSRETAAVDLNYLDSMHALYDEMSSLDEVGELRVSVIAYNPDTQQYFLDWSHSTGDVDNGLTDVDLADLEDRLPILVAGERLILVETFGDYNAPVNVGLGEVNMDTFVFTRPRFGPQLAWTNT
ncbi:hypothetical protein BXY66_2004 [Shimia isoporae]|uniref:Flp pilus assembly protein TadG n=1 Tax=Shimia isoporae TaxID=647720 RepID=A0A4R1NNC0_9RHOB|nr:pilus assembly protein [Shimia isoporae]TCL09937.1 hypothetical protein BXY66_2004 [Shimia isoporae]